MNGISPTTWTATLAHCAEVLDDHASDSNHKKMLRMTTFLCQHHREASDSLQHSEQYFMELSQVVGIETLDQWTKEIEEAELNQLKDAKVMDIYGPQIAEMALTSDPVTALVQF